MQNKYSNALFIFAALLFLSIIKYSHPPKNIYINIANSDMSKDIILNLKWLKNRRTGIFIIKSETNLKLIMSVKYII